MSASYVITLEETPDPADVAFIREGLRVYNLLYAPEDGHHLLVLCLRDGNQAVVGGLLGGTYWGWLHVEILWLAEQARHQGYGHKLLVAAEQEALRRGCYHAHFDTLSFQALPFYQRHGYEVYGVLEDLPIGHQRYFLKKKLKKE